MDPILILIICLAAATLSFILSVAVCIWDDRRPRKSRPQRGSSFDRDTNFQPTITMNAQSFSATVIRHGRINRKKKINPDVDGNMTITVGTSTVIITKEQAMSFFDLQPRYDPDKEMGSDSMDIALNIARSRYQ